MNMLVRALLVAGTVSVLATGCGSGTGDGGGASKGSTPSLVVAPFDATVALSDFSATCREVTCWLPTQFGPRLVKGETVSLRDRWPMDGMAVRVVCETKGEPYNDQVGQSTDAWYGIVVPIDRLEPGAKARAQEAPGGSGWVGYVGAAWIKGGSGKQAPAC